MRKIIPLLCFCFLPATARTAPLGPGWEPAIVQTAPLSLNWEKEYTIFEPPSGFKYYMGDIDWGELVFIGTEDLLGAETELQLFFIKKRIAKVILILGTEGIDTYNCISKYKAVVKWLNKKYGQFQHEQLEKDPLVDELIHVSVCEPVRLGMLHIKNTWRSRNFMIYSSLVGDEDGFYVEIEYVARHLRKSLKQINKDKILKSL